MIDTWGRGFKKIREGFEKAGMPMPKVGNFCGGVQVVIDRAKFVQMTNVVSDVSSVSVVQLTERQRKIIDLINENPFCSGERMSEVLSVVPRTIWRDIADLQKKGILIREGNTSAGHWVVIQK